MTCNGRFIALAFGLVFIPWDGVGGPIAVLGRTAQADAPSDKAGSRVRRGLVALYDFQSPDGTLVKDRSGAGKPIDLRIGDTKAVRRSRGLLEVRRRTLIRSEKPASRIIDAVRKSGEITIEAWLQPAETGQSGPARIITLSSSPSERNFTLGQEGDRFDVRLRTTKTSRNGIPSLSSASKSLQTKLTHVVYTRDRSGRAQITINGQAASSRKVNGKTSNWDRKYRLALANELSNDRPWRGTYFLVAIYGRALSAKEIQRNFQAGAGKGAETLRLAQRKRAQNGRLFKTRVARLLARRCFECHSEKSKKGQLDLSKKYTALRGGDSGRLLVPGNAKESLLWQMVSSDDMPKNRQPLSKEEKRLLKFWIDGGANWSLETIDPAKYAPVRRDGVNWLRRLTVAEYIETVRVTVGVDVAKEARKILPPDLRADGFSNTAYNLTVDLGHVEAYAKLARIIVGRMDTKKFAARYSRRRDLSEANLGKLISGMGKWLLRGPLKDREVAAFLKVAEAVKKEGGDFDETVGFILEAMLQSPRFIYRMEVQRGDGTAQPVGDYELASRLSYILWGGPPDRELIRAADAGELSDRRHLQAQVRRMLKDRRAVDKSLQFASEWLNLARLNNLRPNPKTFPKWDAGLAADMRRETLAFFEEVTWTQDRPLADLYNAQVTFLTPRLAKHYGLKPKKGGRGASAAGDLVRYDLSKTDSRGGLLTHGSVLTVGGDEASMVSRGLFVLHDVLNGEVSDPPPCVDTTPVPTKPGLSQRKIAEARIANQACGGCHSKFEPLAFGLEKFDGLGTFHEVDHHGNRLRDDGEILFPGADKPVPYQSSAELMNLLAKSERVQQTLTRKVTQFALGRPLTQSDEPALESIHQSARKNGGSYADVITAIVLSDLVRKTRTETVKKPSKRGKR